MRRWLLVTVVSLAVLAGGGTVAWRHYAGAVEQMDLLGEAARDSPPQDITIESAPRPTRGPTRGPVSAFPREPAPAAQPGRNLLLVGIDARPGEDQAGARADSIIVVHVSAGGDRAWLVSLPRDTKVEIPGYGTDKLNAAYTAGSRDGGRAGGFALLAATVRRLTGLVFDAGAIIDFTGLQRIVDAVGGVELCVDVETVSVHIGWDAGGRQTPPFRLIPPTFRPERIAGVRPQVYPVGCRHFAGWEALDYVRQRELLPDGDYGRQRHQQQLLTALGERFTSAGVLGSPLTLNRALTAVGESLTFDGNGRSVTDWVLRLRGLRPDAVTMLRTNGGRFTAAQRNGTAFEQLDPTSLALFGAARQDRLDAFAEEHPDWVIQP